MLRLFRGSARLFAGLRVGVRTSAGPPRAAARLSSLAGRTLSGRCTVDPQMEEKFVFVDCEDVEDARQEEEEPQLLGSAPAPPPKQQPPSSAGAKQRRALERQLEALRGATQQGAEPEPEPDVVPQFHDVDFPLDEDVVRTAKKKKKKKGRSHGEHPVYGTPDPSQPVSATCCPGCGAVLHCVAADMPGFLPSEKFKALLEQERLDGATCQRCHLLTHHHVALHLQMSRDEYRAVLSRVRPHEALVLLVVDLLDLPDSIVPDLPELVGRNKQVVVLGNKADLLPADAPNYLQRTKRQLRQLCQDAGVGPQLCDVHLISAKTGYGVEELVSSLQGAWRYKGDVYLVGSANAGKSTLFNALLESDYCKARASDLIRKATISPWPGTTLNLLKFPITNPTPYRRFRRQERLKEAKRQTEDEMSTEERRRLKALSRQGYLVGRVGRTFLPERSVRQEIDFDPDSLAEGDEEEEGGRGGERKKGPSAPPLVELTHSELKDAHWLHDTPGVMKERDILNLLSEQEVRLVVPTLAIVPRTFVLSPGTCLFVGALARIDVLQGPKSCWLSVMASGRVPVHVTTLEKADDIYQKHAGHQLLGVPVGGAERMQTFPPLVPRDVQLRGRGYTEASADITLSSAGWVAVTAVQDEDVSLRVHGPEDAGFSVRTPPLLPHVVTLKGERLRNSAAYKPLKSATRLRAGLPAGGAVGRRK